VRRHQLRFFPSRAPRLLLCLSQIFSSLVGFGQWCRVGLACRRFLWLSSVRPPVSVPPANFPVAGDFPLPLFFHRKRRIDRLGCCLGFPTPAVSKFPGQSTPGCFCLVFFPTVLCSASGFFGCSTLLAQCLALSVWKVRSFSFLGVAEERFLSD